MEAFCASRRWRDDEAMLAGRHSCRRLAPPCYQAATCLSVLGLRERVPRDKAREGSGGRRDHQEYPSALGHVPLLRRTGARGEGEVKMSSVHEAPRGGGKIMAEGRSGMSGWRIAPNIVSS